MLENSISNFHIFDKTHVQFIENVIGIFIYKHGTK